MHHEQERGHNRARKRKPSNWLRDLTDWIDGCIHREIREFVYVLCCVFNKHRLEAYATLGPIDFDSTTYKMPHAIVVGKGK
jgi:hypothetical protein